MCITSIFFHRPRMWRRGFTAFAGTTLLVCSFTAWLYLSNHYVVISTSNSFGDSSEILSDLILQRNNISRLMNLKQKIIGQMECKVMVFIMHQNVFVVIVFFCVLLLFFVFYCFDFCFA